MDLRVSYGLRMAVAVVVAWASWQFGYQPARDASQRSRARVAQLTQQLGAFDALVQGAGGLDAWRAQQQAQLTKLRAQFPQQAQLPEVINGLVNGFKTSDVRLLDVSQGNLEPVQHEGTPVLIDGQPCQRLVVTISAEGRYHALVGVIERFSTAAVPGLVRVERLELTLKDPSSAVLAATMQLSVYLVGARE